MLALSKYAKDILGESLVRKMEDMDGITTKAKFAGLMDAMDKELVELKKENESLEREIRRRERRCGIMTKN